MEIEKIVMDEDPDIIAKERYIQKLDISIAKAFHGIKDAKQWLTNGHTDDHIEMACVNLDHANEALGDAIEAMKKIKW